MTSIQNSKGKETEPNGPGPFHGMRSNSWLIVFATAEDGRLIMP